ncbi:MAG: SRPBCC family protein [Archangium sp.]|nr:SRPBCC family protein [Archangium sp.]
MKKRIAAVVVVSAVVVLAIVGRVGRATTWSSVGPEQAARVFPLPAHAEVPPSPDLVVERFIVITAPPGAIYELLAAVEQWPTWDPAITSARADAHRSLEVGDTFSKEESGTAITARVLEAEPGRLLRWRGLAPGGIVGIHSLRLVALDERRTLVVNREEYSAWFLRLVGGVTDLGIGAQFDRTLGALRVAAESRPATAS